MILVISDYSHDFFYERLVNRLRSYGYGFNQDIFDKLNRFGLNLPHCHRSFVGVLELISEFAKVVSFSFRLFGNVFAGEVLLVIIGFLVPYLIPLPFLFLEIFVGFIQAFIFAMLTLVFIAAATTEETAH